MKDTVHPVDEVINKMKEVEGFGGLSSVIMTASCCDTRTWARRTS